MPSRQETIANNKSLRLVKTELENLYERGVITDDAFDQIHRLLPAESSMSGAPTPAAKSPSEPPVKAMGNLGISQNATPTEQPPPAYHATGPPSLPARNNPPPPPPSKPIIAHARALYRYQASDDRDLSFERDDKVAVHEYMNDDWWMGKNQRTGAEGIFPKNYVEIDHSAAPGGFANEKAGFPAQPTYAQNHNASPGVGYPSPPSGQNPYNSSVPPMSIAQGSGGNQNGGAGQSKMSENGKKMGKKMGNAALFGAGATLGSKVINGIF